VMARKYRNSLCSKELAFCWPKGQDAFPRTVNHWVGGPNPSGGEVSILVISLANSLCSKELGKSRDTSQLGNFH
jgi:hypothetical protein